MIFRKLITRESNVVVAIEADNMNEANRIFNKWCEKDNNLDKLNSTLSEKERDIEGYVASFNNWEELNRSTVKCPDFIIEKPDDEPKYDLYIFEPDSDDCPKLIYFNKNVNMEQLINHLSFYDEQYKLTIKTVAYCFRKIDLNTKNHIMPFEAVKRSEDK